MASEKLIVAGIGTDTGKTIVSAILCEALEADYWKPVQAGDLENSDSIKVQNLISNPTSKIHPEAYKLNTPMSPHAAADIDGIEIDSENLSLPDTSKPLIVELAGGLMVPMSKDYLNIDWVAEIGLPVILVSNYYLGSINHTLLSIALLKDRNVPIRGIIFNGEKNKSTFDVILHQTGLKCLMEIEQEAEITQEIILKYAQRFKF